jgi:hypothetical protein
MGIHGHRSEVNPFTVHRPLDFIVFGIPRSGTKTLVRALNLHPHVYCAMERFHHRANHSQIVFPDSFVDATDICDRHDLGKIRRIKKELASKGEILHAGNKLPRYYFALERLNAEVPTLKNIWIYRSPYGFIQSWNRRERNSRRGRWRAGQVGLFGLLELFCCISNCLRLHKDIFVFPYDHGLNHSITVLEQALDFLNASPGIYDRTQFEAKYFGKRREAPHRLALRAYEEEILDALRVGELDAILSQDRSLLVADVAHLLKDYLESISDILPHAVDRAFAACDNSVVSSFAREHFRRNRIELQDLCRLLQKSKSVQEFQRFNLYHYLQALYVQRWALKRRLKSFRFRTFGALPL